MSMGVSEGVENVTDRRPSARTGLLLAGPGLRRLGGVPSESRPQRRRALSRSESQLKRRSRCST